MKRRTHIIKGSDHCEDKIILSVYTLNHRASRCMNQTDRAAGERNMYTLVFGDFSPLSQDSVQLAD